MKKSVYLMIVCAVVMVSAALSAQAAENGKAAAISENDGMIHVFGAGAIWKKHYTFFRPVVSEEAAKQLNIDPKDLKAREGVLGKRRLRFRERGYQYKSAMTTQPPEKNWMNVDYNDSEWRETSGPDLTRGDGRARNYSPLAYLQGSDGFIDEIGLINMRGRFIVKDPSQVKKLMLTVVYRGGFIAYLNGEEIGRRSLPKGTIEYNTPADEFQRELLYSSSGSGKKKQAMNWYSHRDKKYVKDWAKRQRESGPIEIDTKLLKKGLNVLALEIHRAGYSADCVKSGLGIAAIGLGQLQLRAEVPADSIVSSVNRPKEFYVRTKDIWDAVYTNDFGDPAADLMPVRIAGAKNGSFCGQIIVSSGSAIEGLKAEVSPLSSENGKKIPDNAVTLLYSSINPLWPNASSAKAIETGYSGPRFDLLLETPPEKIDITKLGKGIHLTELGLPQTPVNGATVPVWVKIQVPKDTEAGLYKGTVTVKANGVKPVKVPIELSVADWALPDVEDNTAFLFIYQSPDTLAKHYKVEPWSDKHWSMIERSLKLMGEAGNIGLIFPLCAESSLGNAESFVTWIKKGDGTYDYDFSRFDKYLDTALKYHSKERLEAIVLKVWGAENKKKRTSKKKVNGKWVKTYGPPPRSQVTVIDPKTGKKEKLRLPLCGTPESEALWRPLLTQLRDKLKERGLLDQLTLGTSWDADPAPSHVAMFRNILGDVPWIRESHFDRAALKYDETDKTKTVRVRLNSIVWGGGIPIPEQKRLYGWKYNPKHLVLNFNRAGVNALVLNGFPSPWSFRMWMESTLTGGRNGNGRVGGDFFRGGYSRGSGNAGCMFGHYVDSRMGQTGLGNNCTDLFGADPDGPVTTVRFENARQGNQEAEARIFIERAILSKKLPTDLAQKCQDLLDKRTKGLRVWSMINGRIQIGSMGWHEKTEKLYQYAAEVAKVMGK
jgi:hypothetical protein